MPSMFETGNDGTANSAKRFSPRYAADEHEARVAWPENRSARNAVLENLYMLKFILYLIANAKNEIRK